MNTKKTVIIFFIGFIITSSMISIFLLDFGVNESDQNNILIPETAADIAGMNDVLITEISRSVELDGYGIVNIEDSLEIENNYDNQIDAIYIGIPERDSDKLIFYKATKDDAKTSLLVERSKLKSNGFEMIAIYFDSPLLPSQKKVIIFSQSFRDLIYYNEISGGTTHELNYTGPVFPILPYKADGTIKATYTASSTITSADEWVSGDISGSSVTYDMDDKDTYLAPFLENLDITDQNITIKWTESSLTKLEVTQLNREIFISPWGIIRVSEDIIIQNKGEITITSFNMKAPSSASSISISDYLGTITGTEIEGGNVKINLIDPNSPNLDYNRPALGPDSTIRFTLKYNLPFEQYSSLNWFQESLSFDLYTTSFDYLIRDQIITIKIDGCLNIDFNTAPPDMVTGTQGTISIIYYSDNISPLENNPIQLTFTIDIFELTLRPIIFILIIIFVSSLFVILNKARKKEEDFGIVSIELIPKQDIREFCSLSEEKNALVLEMRATTEALKRRKITKKKYKNVIDKNTPKIEQIDREIIPFKESVINAGPVFENLIRKIEFLDAERISVNDGLSLLEARYKEGKLPSRASYQKLADNFLKRRRKIDRNYDKLIQQLRSYLL